MLCRQPVSGATLGPLRAGLMPGSCFRRARSTARREESGSVKSNPTGPRRKAGSHRAGQYLTTRLRLPPASQETEQLHRKGTGRICFAGLRPSSSRHPASTGNPTGTSGPPPRDMLPPARKLRTEKQPEPGPPPRNDRPGTGRTRTLPRLTSRTGPVLSVDVAATSSQDTLPPLAGVILWRDFRPFQETASVGLPGPCPLAPSMADRPFPPPTVPAPCFPLIFLNSSIRAGGHVFAAACAAGTLPMAGNSPGGRRRTLTRSGSARLCCSRRRWRR